MSRRENEFSNLTYVYMLIGAAALAALDQFLKYLAVIYLKDLPSVVLIPGVLELSYLENHGAAFGILQNQVVFFSVLTVIFLAFVVFITIKIPKNRHYLLLLITITVLTAGALGNFIDRLIHKYVVDYIYFSLIDFPVFNAADIYVTLSVISLACLIIFKYKDHDFDFLRRNKENGHD